MQGQTMQRLFAGANGYRLYALRRRFVERLTQESERGGRLECWRMIGPRVQVGHVVGQRRVWQTVPILSVELLRRYRVMKEEEEFFDVPF
jgi:hypothetical protein